MIGVTFMANDKSLISFAVMSTEFGQNEKDYFDMLIPFVLSVLKEHKSDIRNRAINIKEINNQLKDDYGFVLQHNVLEALFRRMTNEKYNYLKMQNRNFYFTDKEIDVNDFLLRRTDASNHQTEVFTYFDKFLKSIPNFEYNETDIKNKLIIYLNRYGFNVLSEQEVELILEDKEDIYTYYIGKFISKMKDENDIIFKYIKEIVKGAMLVSAIHLHTDVSSVKPDKKFKNLSIFFDTPLLMCALGYSGDELRDATMELINTLYKLGVKLFYFQHNIDEVEGILDAYITHYNNNTLDTSYNFEYLRLQDVTPSMAQTYKIMLRHNLEKCHLYFHEYSDNINIDIDLEKLDKFLEFEMSYRIPSRRRNDATSALNVYYLRKRHDFKRIENCQYLFLTPNVTLCSKVKKYFKEEYKEKDFPAIIDDTLLTSIVWLKTAKSSDSIPTLKIISDAVASQMLPRKFWDEFVKNVNYLKENGEISEEDIFRLKYDTFIKNHVYEITQGDTEKISYENLKETLRLAEYHKHKELIDSNNQKDNIISYQMEEILKEKINKYISKPFSRWKILYYISKCGLPCICFIIVIVASIIDYYSESTVSKILKGSSFCGFLISFFKKYTDKFISKFVPTFDSYFLRKSYVTFNKSICEEDIEYKEEIIKRVKTTKYFEKLEQNI